MPGLIDSSTGLARGNGLIWLQGGLGAGGLTAASPVNVTAPAVTGTPQVGETLTVSDGTWQGQATLTYAYQWYDSNGAIGGATANTFELTGDQEGLLVYAAVTASNGLGTARQLSNSVGPVDPA
jgi:hypothetical protein